MSGIRTYRTRANAQRVINLYLAGAHEGVIFTIVGNPYGFDFAIRATIPPTGRMAYVGKGKLPTHHGVPCRLVAP